MVSAHTSPEALPTTPHDHPEGPRTMSRIYVTQTDHDDPYAPEVRAGWFSPDAARYWHGAKEVFDGANLADVNTRDQNSGQGLYRTAQGRWVLRYWSNWQGTTDSYSYTSPEDAREWLLFNEYDDAARELFGEIPEEQGPAVRTLPTGSAAPTTAEQTARETVHSVMAEEGYDSGMMVDIFMEFIEAENLTNKFRAYLAECEDATASDA